MSHQNVEVSVKDNMIYAIQVRKTLRNRKFVLVQNSHAFSTALTRNIKEIILKTKLCNLINGKPGLSQALALVYKL